MKIKALLAAVDCRAIQDGDVEISDIQYDSRKVKKGSLFVCIKGFATDGHLYAAKAVAAGAAAILCQDPLDIHEIPVFQTEDTRLALARISATFYGEPSTKMKVIGVTGTNGKTTITYLLDSIFRAWHKKTGVIGTIANKIGDRVLPADRTTPESSDLQALLADMHKEGVAVALMEVSSHSLELNRVAGVAFDVGIFTNLTQDHLDFHETLENYLAAKAKLFTLCEYGIINIDDTKGDFVIDKANCPVTKVSIERDGDLKATDIQMSPEGAEFVVNVGSKAVPFKIHTPGKFSVYNALCAIGAALYLDVPVEVIQKGLADITGVPGRFQSIRSGRRVAIVDYAHTPDSLENVLKTIHEFAEGRIITVFGCGGDRDRTKRPIMGEIAGTYSDYCIVTSDNPRTEEPSQILKDTEAGVKHTICPYTLIEDRKDAIHYGVSLLQDDDILLIAGKGHETYQIFKDKTIHFDDVEVVRDAFVEEEK